MVHETCGSENKKGFFTSYNIVVEKVSDVILEVNPVFQYSKSLASNMFEMVINQLCFIALLPRLTDIKNKQEALKKVEAMMFFFVFKLLI